MRSTGSVLESLGSADPLLPDTASSRPLCRRKEAEESEESIKYGLYVACPTQQQTVSKAVLEAKLRTTSTSTVLDCLWDLLLATEGRLTNTSSSTA